MQEHRKISHFFNDILPTLQRTDESEARKHVDEFISFLMNHHAEEERIVFPLTICREDSYEQNSTKNCNYLEVASFTRFAPFYFKRFGQVIGVAWDVNDLRRELVRLGKEDPAALQYHLWEGHIVRWLESSNEKELADQLRRVENVKEAISRVNIYLERKQAASCNEPMPFHKLHPRTHPKF